MRGGPGKGRGQGMPQSMLGMQQPMPARPSFGQLMTQGPMNMPRPTPRPVPFMGRVGNNMPQPPMDFPQPTARPVDQTMGRPMPQQSFMGRVANNMPEAPFNAYNRPMGRVGNNMPRLQRPLPSNMEYGMGFYGGGITDLY
jgi:hypothetical protein